MRIVAKFLAIAVFSLPATAWSAFVAIGQGSNVNAFFARTSPDGCVQTGVSVFAFKSISHEPPGSKNLFSFGATVNLFQYDACAGTQLIGAFGEVALTDPEYEVAPSLNSAALNTTVTLDDFTTGAVYVIDVNLAWTSTAPPLRSMNHNFFGLPGCVQIQRFNGTSAPAVASGNVSLGTTNYISGPDEGADGASIGWNRDGLVAACQ